MINVPDWPETLGRVTLLQALCLNPQRFLAHSAAVYVERTILGRAFDLLRLSSSRR
jgi:hypothetical protein